MSKVQTGESTIRHRLRLRVLIRRSELRPERSLPAVDCGVWELHKVSGSVLDEERGADLVGEKEPVFGGWQKMRLSPFNTWPGTLRASPAPGRGRV